jgi:two-component system cell cycle sensor histidine kinase/response regulator CckA
VEPPEPISVERQVQLAALQKMEALGRLAAEVAHDFNNLLVVVSMSGSLLRKTLPAGSRELVHVDEMIRAAERGGALTRQLMTFARGGAARIERIDLSRCLAKVGDVVKLLVGQDIELRMAVDRDVSSIEFDRCKLEQILVGLADNARQAMTGGGTLTFTATNAELRLTEAGALSLAPGAYVRLTVEDTGIGIAPDVVDRIFEPYFTTWADVGGRGLGLSTAYGITRHHGGHIEVRSTLGAGTAFDLYVPAVTDD